MTIFFFLLFSYMGNGWRNQTCTSLCADVLGVFRGWYTTIRGFCGYEVGALRGNGLFFFSLVDYLVAVGAGESTWGKCLNGLLG